MDTQFDLGLHGGRVLRPAVIPRNINPGIITRNFKLSCAGQIFSGVLEDEMYMSDVVENAKVCIGHVDMYTYVSKSSNFLTV